MRPSTCFADADMTRFHVLLVVVWCWFCVTCESWVHSCNNPQLWPRVWLSLASVPNGVVGKRLGGGQLWKWPFSFIFVNHMFSVIYAGHETNLVCTCLWSVYAVDNELFTKTFYQLPLAYWTLALFLTQHNDGHEFLSCCLNSPTLPDIEWWCFSGNAKQFP